MPRQNGAGSPRSFTATWRAMDSNSCLPIPSGCQKYCSASQLFSLESANAPRQKVAPNTKLTSLGLCPSLHTGLVIFHCLVSLLIPSSRCIIFYEALLVVLRGGDCPYYLDRSKLSVAQHEDCRTGRVVTRRTESLVRRFSEGLLCELQRFVT